MSELTKICEQCNKVFSKNEKYRRSRKSWEAARFCSQQCYQMEKYIPVEPKECEQCGETFFRKENYSKSDREKQRFCTQQCWGTWRSRSDEDLYKIDKNSGCWNFIRALKHDGYGGMKRKGKQILAHRYFYEKYKDEIPEGLQIDHLCRNKKCVNPNHLEPVTGAENTRRANSTKLTKESVHLIRELWAKTKWTQRELGILFGVHRRHIGAIVRCEVWIVDI